MTEPITVAERDPEYERLLGIVFNVSPAQASALSCLIRSTVVSSADLLEHTGSKSQVKVIVSRTRSQMRTFGFDIHSKKEVGYWIEPADKQGIKKKVDDFVAG